MALGAIPRSALFEIRFSLRLRCWDWALVCMMSDYAKSLATLVCVRNNEVDAQSAMK